MPYIGKEPARVPVTAADIPDNSITAAKILDGVITAADLAANSVDSSELVDGSIDTSHIGDLQVTTAKVAANAVTGAKIANDAIDSIHYAADSIDTEHYAAGSVDTTALGADSVTAAKIADDVINSEHYAAASIDNEHLADDAVGIAELSATGTASSSTYLRGDNSWQTAGSTSASDLTSGTLPIARIANDAIDSIHYAAASIDNEHLADDAVGVAELSATGTASSSTYLRGDNSWATLATGNTTANPMWEMAHTVSSNYTMTTNYNGVSVAPVTINSGVAVTVPTGSTWVIV